MIKKKQKKSAILIILHTFLGIGAIVSGIILIIDPSGEWMHLPLSLLENSPFPNYLIPGFILFFVLGILPLVVASALMKRWSWKIGKTLNIFPDKHWSWTFSLYIGFALIIWIIVQIFIIRELSILQLIYIILGLMIQIVTLLPTVQEKYRE